MKTSQKIYLPFKRLIDIIGSLLGIVLCFAFLWWWILIVNCFFTRFHPVFCQERLGKNGESFGCLKFRTMYVSTNPNLSSLDEFVDKNVTPFGSFLRKTSLDETLQLINILFGKMSFIGPRPLIGVGIDAITINRRKENGSITLKPGLSGYAQLHEREKLDPIKKADFDYCYLIHFSFFLDLKLFIFSIFKSINK